MNNSVALTEELAGLASARAKCGPLSSAQYFHKLSISPKLAQSWPLDDSVMTLTQRTYATLYLWAGGTFWRIFTAVTNEQQQRGPQVWPLDMMHSGRVIEALMIR